MDYNLVPTIIIILGLFATAVLVSICMLAVFKARNFVKVKNFTRFFLLSYMIAMFITIVFSLLLFNN